MHIFELYPKFHCECNYIERYWGVCKRKAREECNYSFQGLMNRLPGILDSIDVNLIQKFARKSWRYIECYANGLDGRLAEHLVKKYKSHRRLAEGFENEHLP